MEEPGLDKRHRDKNGEISKKHGNDRPALSGPGGMLV